MSAPKLRSKDELEVMSIVYFAYLFFLLLAGCGPVGPMGHVGGFLSGCESKWSVAIRLVVGYRARL